MDNDFKWANCDKFASEFHKKVILTLTVILFLTCIVAVALPVCFSLYYCIFDDPVLGIYWLLFSIVLLIAYEKL